MTKQQKNKIQELGGSVLNHYYQDSTGLVVAIIPYDGKRVCKTYIGPRGNMNYRNRNVYEEYSKEKGLTGFLFKDVT